MTETTHTTPDLSDTTGSPDPEMHPIGRGTAASLGVISAGVALGIGELMSGLSNRIPSLIVRVGDVVIDNAPGSVERWAIDTLGTNDKPALIIGIIIISLIIGAITGIAANKRPATAFVVFGLFGLIGGLAAASDPQRPALGAWITAVLAALGGALALRFLLTAAKRMFIPGASLSDMRNSRRTFVGTATAAAALGVAGPVLGGALRGRQSAEVEGDRDAVAAALDAIEQPTAPPTPTAEAASTTLEAETTAMPSVANFDDIDGISTLISPNDNFYRIDSALSIPRIDVDTWSMKITGMVDQELEFSFEDLLNMDPVEEFVTLSCVSNRVGGDLVGTARWLGVPLRKILDMAGVQAGAIAMNGEPLPTQHGFPVRLVIAGLYGYVSATKWLKEIELTTWDEFDGYWITRGWSKEGPIKTQSRIDVPNPNARISAGPQPIAGVAWAPDRGVSKVEVLVTDLVDGQEIPNDNWMEAELSEDLSNNAWRQWMIPSWEPPAGDYVIRVRATDSTGETQTPVRTDVAPNGATGWHAIPVRVT